MLPEELTLREPSVTIVVGIGLFVSFALIALAKLLKSNVFRSLIISSTKIGQLKLYLKENYPLNKGGSILLLVNYITSFSLVVFMTLSAVQLDLQNVWLVSLLIPTGYLAWSIITMLVTGLVTAERVVFGEAVAMKLIGAQIVGVVFFILASVNSLYSIDPQVFVIVVLALVIFEAITRYFKSIVAVSSYRVSWYYIILYFCTLEILPLFVAYYLVMKDFK